MKRRAPNSPSSIKATTTATREAVTIAIGTSTSTTARIAPTLPRVANY